MHYGTRYIVTFIAVLMVEWRRAGDLNTKPSLSVGKLAKLESIPASLNVYKFGLNTLNWTFIPVQMPNLYRK